MNQQQAMARWRSEQFLHEIQPALEAVFTAKRNHHPLDLRGIRVGAEAVLPYLRDKDFSHAQLTGIDLSYAQLTTSFDDGDFRRIRFAKAHFTGCTLSRARFSDCAFDAAILNIEGTETTFERCSFSDARFMPEPHAASRGGPHLVFRSCDFSRATFVEFELIAARFIDCNFTDAVFDRCNLQDTKFYVNVPDLPQFSNCNLRGTRFAFEAPETEG
ncbi:MAG: pentapeptide repeat-containing protein [Gammaproteobacteria bacterium]